MDLFYDQVKPWNAPDKSHLIFRLQIFRIALAAGWLAVHLNGLKTVAVITEDPRQFHLPDLLELLQGEWGGEAARLVPEPVAKLEVVEGSAHHAGKGRTHQRTRPWYFCDSGRPKVWNYEVQLIITNNTFIGNDVGNLFFSFH